MNDNSAIVWSVNCHSAVQFRVKLKHKRNLRYSKTPFHHPQMKLRKGNAFRSVSRLLSTGGGWYPSMHWGRPHQEDGIPACTGADPPHQEGRPPPADGYCCGRYTSYWNAILFGICMVPKKIVSTIGPLSEPNCVWYPKHRN